MNVQADVNAVIAQLKAQRNTYADDLAMLNGVIATQQQRIEALEAENAELKSSPKQAEPQE